MKRFFCVLLIFFTGTVFFADIWIKTEITGVSFESTHNCSVNYEVKPGTTNSEFHTFGLCSLSALWEFNSKQELPYYWTAGISTGLFSTGIKANAAAGINVIITRFENTVLEWDSCLQIGPHFDFFGGINLNAEISSDVVLINKSRKDFFVGIGISEAYLGGIQNSLTYGNTYIGINELCLHVCFGLKPRR